LNGRGSRRTVFTTLKMVALAPTQTARVRKTVALKAFSFQRSFRPNRRSRRTASMGGLTFLESAKNPAQDQFQEATEDGDHAVSLSVGGGRSGEVSPPAGSGALTLMGARRGAGAHPYEAASSRVSRRVSECAIDLAGTEA
jgi:hypothetical protein